MEDNLFTQLQSGTGNFMDYFINFGQELKVFEDVLLMIFIPGIGLLISASAVWDVMKMRDPKHANKVTSTSVAMRMVIGPLTILLVPLISAVAQSLFGNDQTGSNMPRAYRYADAAANGDPTQALTMTILAFLVFIGWITGLRAMIAYARIGHPSTDGFELFKAGTVRLFVATALTMFQFVLDDVFESFTGQADQFSSELNL
ncbi:hypothetical protein [Marinobacter gelidimuriae]|jgi:hypothetical protein|uniref:hypothetical protein n=1 Tax=Marinobacter gelidimuriae TaxID=2739064 RepID=UPI00035C1D7C|nr:hypothetical protein [Marinobacter gelidimuriae]